MWKATLHYRKIVKWLVLYLVIVGAALGLTAVLVRNFVLALSPLSTFENSYPFFLLFVGFCVLTVGLALNPSKETETTRPQESFESTYFYFRSWLFRRVQRTGYERQFLLAGITLITISFFLLWLWNV
jgi:hypothetical protein